VKGVTLDEWKPTEVFETYWRFAAERHSIYLKRLRGEPPPWTSDPDLQRYRFTNVFRAADRVSQYLIRPVIYQSGGSDDDEEVVFRTLLFKLFNSIPAWEEALLPGLGEVPSWRKFDLTRYARILGDAWKRGVKIWNPAYTQRPQTGLSSIDSRYRSKHERYLAVLESRMLEGITRQLKAARTYEEAFNVLLRRGLFGDFLSMQFLTDLNYSEVINFDENDFIRAGPGALDGIRKCFKKLFRSKLNLKKHLPGEIIRLCVRDQEKRFRGLGLETVTLFGRPLSLIDAQNIFCETDKLARVKHPGQEFVLDRREIKQKFVPPEAKPLPAPFFPPKWGLNVSLTPEPSTPEKKPVRSRLFEKIRRAGAA
jgi:hypothetical protein